MQQIFAGFRKNSSPKTMQNPNIGERLGRLRDSLAGGAGASSLVTATGSLKIALEGFPRGSKTSVKTSGFFKDVNVDRGRAGAWTEAS
jgi:hypothetical protein